MVCAPDTGGVLDADGRYLRIHEHAPLVAAGFAVFSVDHRGSQGHGNSFAAQADFGGREVDDVLAAAQYLTRLPEIDTKRVSIFGTSRGAYIASLALSRIPAVWHRAVLAMGFYDPVRYLAEQRAARPGTSRLTEYGNWEEFAELIRPRNACRWSHWTSLPRRSTFCTARPKTSCWTPTIRAISPHEPRRPASAQLVTVPELGHDIDHTHPA